MTMAPPPAANAAGMSLGLEVGILGRSPPLVEALSLAKRAASSQLPIMLVGETGTGKELFARAVHRWSARAGPLIDVNCGALPAELAEGELFGHRKGAFTGAHEDRRGLVAAADGGTLFLDEVSSLPMLLQSKFLRVLESRVVRRLGEVTSRLVDFRLVSATLAPESDLLGLRPDLLHRLAGVVVRIPPLRSRAGDVRLLASSFAQETACWFEEAALVRLEGYSWPGNVRELRAVVERAGLFATDGVLGEAALEFAMNAGSQAPPPGPDREMLVRRAFLERCLTEQLGADAMAAAAGVHRATIFRWLKECGMRVPRHQAHRLGSAADSVS